MSNTFQRPEPTEAEIDRAHGFWIRMADESAPHIAQLIATVRAEERERCAKICDSVADQWDPENDSEVDNYETARECALHIREQKP